MAGRAGLNRAAWPALALALALLSGGAWLAGADSNRWDWQPGLAWSQPWRCWTAAAVHHSAWHLGANLAGCAVVGGFGLAAGCCGRAVLAWLLAWPLGVIGLAWQPELGHYAGLSGLLHAGVAIAAWQAWCGGRRGWLGLAVLAGLAAKIASESPWGPALRPLPEWGIAVAPLAHATGALAGLLCALALLRRRQPGGQAGT